MIRLMTNTSSEFYRYMRDLLMTASIDGVKIRDIPGKIWYVDIRPGIGVVGFAATIEYSICSCYVLPEYRRRGIMRNIVSDIITRNGGYLDAACNIYSAPLFSNLGFRPVGVEDGYIIMELVR